jgi:hypothetical protein
VLFLVHRFLSRWWRRRQVPPKRRFLQEPHGVTTQKTPFFKLIVSIPNSFNCNKTLACPGFKFKKKGLYWVQNCTKVRTLGSSIRSWTVAVDVSYWRDDRPAHTTQRFCAFWYDHRDNSEKAIVAIVLICTLLCLPISCARIIRVGHAAAKSIQALFYKPESRGMNFRWSH